MVRVTVEITEGPTNRRVNVTAPSIARAVEMAGGEAPGRSVRLLFPIAPEDFFVDRTRAQTATREPEAA